MLNSNHLKNTLRLANGKWPAIHMAAGISSEFLQNKHGPCPMCGGKDRYRYDNKDSRGTYYCNQCGAGDGLELIKRFKECTTSEALRFVNEHLGFIQHNPEKPWHVMKYAHPVIKDVLSSQPAELQGKLNYILAKAVTACPAHPYLVNKKLPADGLRQYKDSIIVPLYHAEYKLVSCQFINPDNTKRFLTGTPKKGAYSIVGKHHPHDPIIIAEGFATAMSIHLSLDLPIFIGIDCNNLELALESILRNKQHNGEIIIAADNDPHGKSLLCAKIAITNLGLKQARIIMPNRVDYDWNDIYCEEGSEAIRAAFSGVKS